MNPYSRTRPSFSHYQQEHLNLCPSFHEGDDFNHYKGERVPFEKCRLYNGKKTVNSEIPKTPPERLHLPVTSKPLFEEIDDDMSDELVMKPLRKVRINGQRLSKSGLSTLECYVLTVDTRSYPPDKIDVQIIDRDIEVSAHREEKGPSMTKTRTLNRRVHMPEDAVVDNTQSWLTEFGELHIQVPVSTHVEHEVRKVPIVFSPTRHVLPDKMKKCET